MFLIGNQTIVPGTSVTRDYYGIIKNEKISEDILDHYYKILGQEEYKTVYRNDYMEYTVIKDDFWVLEKYKESSTPIILEKGFHNKHEGYILNDTENNIIYCAIPVDETEIILYINGIRYAIKEQDGNIRFIAENGNELLAYSSHEIDSQYKSYKPAGFGEDRERAVSWKMAVSGAKKESSIVLTAVGILASVAGVITWNCTSAIGLAIAITGLFTAVGQSKTVTLYVIYDQYYRSDCTTYIKEVDRYYKKNDYTEYAGTKTIYFHSVKPDHAGQNCLAYSGS